MDSSNSSYSNNNTANSHKQSEDYTGKEYSPGMRVLIRGEEWTVKETESVANLVAKGKLLYEQAKKEHPERFEDEMEAQPEENTALNEDVEAGSEKTDQKDLNKRLGKRLRVIGVTPFVRDQEYYFLDAADPAIEVDPTKMVFVPDKSSYFLRSKLFIESHWRRQVPTDSHLHIGHRAAMDTLPYQLEPAQMALSSLRSRILIADSVGLGKTLEAGILMSELIIRGKGRRILVVTGKSMMQQFQKEMWSRFTLPLVRLDSERIHRLRSEVPVNYNPFNYFDKIIISIDTLKRSKYQNYLEKARWDIIVIDEAQNVAIRGTEKNKAQRAELAELLAKRSEHMIMLSATPHDGKPESFASLMQMLEPTAIANSQEYGPQDIRGLFIRRFKKDIKQQFSGQFLERKFSIEQITASATEEEAYAYLSDMQLEMDNYEEGRRINGGLLFKTLLVKSIFSSPAACLSSIDERLKKLQKKFEDQEFGDIEKLTELKRYVEAIDIDSFSKYKLLKKLLTSSEYGWKKNNSSRVVIFTERIETMKFLEVNLRLDLKLDEGAVVAISGRQTDLELQEIVESFGRNNSPIRILIATDIASEGINLHYFCHRLIHFDITWSLMVFQQRNGRIDRYGQQYQPDIRYLQTKSQALRGDERILEILTEKEEQAEKNIGDPTMLYSLNDEEKETERTGRTIERANCGELKPEDFDRELKADDFLARLFTMDSEDDEDGSESADTADSAGNSPQNNRQAIAVHTVTDRTIFTDTDFLTKAFDYFKADKTEEGIREEKNKEEYDYKNNGQSLEVKVTEEIANHLEDLLPEEIAANYDEEQEEYLELSPNAKCCMDDIKACLNNSTSLNPWPRKQYLWRLHPLLDWVIGKTSMFYERDQIPLLGVTQGLPVNDCLFIVIGSWPNLQSDNVLDTMFALHYFSATHSFKVLEMEKALHLSGLENKDLPNPQRITNEDIEELNSLIVKIIDEAKKHLEKCKLQYENTIKTTLAVEIEQLHQLQEKHERAVKLLVEKETSIRKKQIAEMFKELEKWKEDRTKLAKIPYLRIIAGIKGVKSPEQE